TFVHDWLALAIGFVVVGHVWFALNDRQARIGMRTGWVTRGWVEREHQGWAAELAAAEAEAGGGDGDGDGDGANDASAGTDPDTYAVSEAPDRAARGEAGTRDR